VCIGIVQDGYQQERDKGWGCLRGASPNLIRPAEPQLGTTQRGVAPLAVRRARSYAGKILTAIGSIPETGD
jgi:hypothetical protein